MKRVLSIAIAGALLCVFASSVRAEATVASADTPSKTPAGVTFTLPKDWSEEQRPSIVVLTPPEGNMHVAIVDVGAAPNADAATAAAWKLYDPSMHRKLVLATSAPGRNGWDEARNYSYDSSPNEHLDVNAGAVRAGARWTVIIVEGSDATMEKRAGAINLALAGLRPGGYQRESFAGRTPNSLDAARIATLTRFVRTGMKELDIPGVAMALVDRGKVVYEGGFGVRALGDPAPVDEHTLFMIASNTKGMTTLLMARLVDRGKLRWDEHVTEAYPSFRLGDDTTTKQVLIRDLICACTGIPRKDFDWIFNTTGKTPPSDTFRELARTQPTSKFGDVFQYSNIMASAAGYIAGSLVYPGKEIGAAYDSAMQSMIFDPLGMNDSTFDMDKALAGNHASPHGYDIDGAQKLASNDFNHTAIPIRPAGEAWSSAHDFLKYVEDELTEGVLPDGSRFVSAESLLARRADGVVVSEDLYYGMGLMDDDRYGVHVITHGGDLAGYHSNFYAIPSAGVGAVILTNSDSGVSLRAPFARRLLEVLYDGKPEAEGNLAAAAMNLKAGIEKTRELLTVPPAPSASSGLAARYENPDLGHIDVIRDASGVTFDFGQWKSHVASRTNPDGTISLFTIDPTVDGFEFVVGSNNGKRTLVIRDGQHKYVYTAV